MSQVFKSTLVFAALIGVAAVLYAVVGEPRDLEWFVFFGVMVLMFGLIGVWRWRRAQLDPAAQKRTPQRLQ